MNTTWVYNSDHDAWVCQACKLEWQFMHDGPVENEVNYCPRCGLQITEEGNNGTDYDS